ncbi:hypothetical protein SAMN04487819_11688 [Actinopolyspora alba]|uniref:Uncharacterized protein n=1 Tax=Actinopolyspora alba TaxID=673379 RepID=A0A1I2BG96_9ACTN|nr:hypothetical protein [Actinopolyspora alba]SFE55146.1 hypothetical protein SAMN04487819_11688 [Actinopolyspora alba]
MSTDTEQTVWISPAMAARAEALDRAHRVLSGRGLTSATPAATDLIAVAAWITSGPGPDNDGDADADIASLTAFGPQHDDAVDDDEPADADADPVCECCYSLADVAVPRRAQYHWKHRDGTHAAYLCHGCTRNWLREAVQSGDCEMLPGQLAVLLREATPADLARIVNRQNDRTRRR